EIVVGDITGTGSVVIADALEILRFIIGLPCSIQAAVICGDCHEPSPSCASCIPANKAWHAAAAVTGGDNVGISDALHILRFIIGLRAPSLEDYWWGALPNPPPRPPDDSHTINWTPVPRQNFTPRRGHTTLRLVDCNTCTVLVTRLFCTTHEDYCGESIEGDDAPAPECLLVEVREHGELCEECERELHIPDMIVFHTTGGTTRSAINWLNNPTSEVSYHFIIAGDGTITQHVDITHWAYANGTNVENPTNVNHISRATHPTVIERNTNANFYTIAIAFGDMPESSPSYAQMDAAAWLIQHVRWEVLQIYGTTLVIDREHVIGHNQINSVRKADCPGRNFPFTRILRLFNVRG
ncbi:MAG: peptidoglycan recognition protein family protein, partial [Oscillospiraceae bacterium]|nr:peptidoglycan recognition protein family protein [Oscillospiraceae bacterium]